MRNKNCEGPDTLGIGKILEAMYKHVLCHQRAGGCGSCALVVPLHRLGGVGLLYTKQGADKKDISYLRS